MTTLRPWLVISARVVRPALRPGRRRHRRPPRLTRVPTRRTSSAQAGFGRGVPEELADGGGEVVWGGAWRQVGVPGAGWAGVLFRWVVGGEQAGVRAW